MVERESELHEAVADFAEARRKANGATPADVEDQVAKAYSKELLLKSVDQVCVNWISTMKEVREHSVTTETLLVQHAARVKEQIETMYRLAATSMADAKRMHDTNVAIQAELERAAEG